MSWQGIWHDIFLRIPDNICQVLQTSIFMLIQSCQPKCPLQNLPMQYTEICSAEKWKISPDKNDNFTIFAQNIDCRCMFRTASQRRCSRIPIIYGFEQKYEKQVNPSKPKFICIKMGFKGVFIHGHVFLMLPQNHCGGEVYVTST